jgi:hypothetical protein
LGDLVISILYSQNVIQHGNPDELQTLAGCRLPLLQVKRFRSRCPMLQSKKHKNGAHPRELSV